ncbi:MAG: hypothetical protein HOV80_11245 [Polyangiaceae bacterium]|nr:hypothetical protein [Polyangiaceae bacterium]
MLSKASFEACPSCGCHVARGSISCPHCDRVFERTRGRLQPAIVAVMMGLGAVAASSTACSGGSGDDGAGGEGAGAADDDDDGGYPSAVSTYGVGPSVGPGVTTTQSSSTGVICPEIDDGTPCGECLALSCCDEALSCEESQPCIDASDCVKACDPNDLACATTCQETYPEGFTLYQALFECGSASCEKCFVD